MLKNNKHQLEPEITSQICLFLFFQNDFIDIIPHQFVKRNSF